MSPNISYFDRFNHIEELTFGFQEIDEVEFNIWFEENSISSGPFSSYTEITPTDEMIQSFKDEYGRFPPAGGCHINSLQAASLLTEIELMCGITYPERKGLSTIFSYDYIVHSYNWSEGVIMDFSRLREDGTPWHDIFKDKEVIDDPFASNGNLPVNYKGVIIDQDLIEAADIDSQKSDLLAKQFLKDIG